MSMSEPLVPHDHSDDERIAAADAGDGAPVVSETQPSRDDAQPSAPTGSDATEDDDPARPSVLRTPTGDRLAPEELAAESE
jgi:hypothetical protein